jgi:hypothetical protein
MSRELSVGVRMSTDESPPGVVRKQRSRSGLVDFADQVILHATRSARIVLVPIFIPHASRPPGLTLKLVRQRIRWTGDDEPDTEINLDEGASQQLLADLPRLAELSGHPNGDYLVVPIEGDFKIGAVPPDVVASALVRVLSDAEIATRFAASELTEELVKSLRSNLRLRDLQAAVEELRQYLAVGITDEATFQRWCRLHGWVFGISYQEPDEVREIAVGDTVDFLLPTLVGYRDLVELKRPDMPVLSYDRDHRNYFWSRDTAMAIGQCARYLEQLQETRLRDQPEIVAHHPRATVVIGRSAGWPDEQVRALVSLNARLTGITVLTFDLLLMQAERLLEIVTASDA